MMCTDKSFPWKWQEWSVTVSPGRALAVWKLRYFSEMDVRPRDYLESQNFKFLYTTWKLRMYPCGHHESTVGEVLPYLMRVSSINEFVSVKYKFFYRDKFMNEYHSSEQDEDFYEGSCKAPSPSSIIKIKYLLNGGDLQELLLAEDTLTVCCEIKDPNAGEREEAFSEEILKHTIGALGKTMSDLKKNVQRQKNEIRGLHKKLANVTRQHSQLEGRVESLEINNEIQRIINALNKGVSESENIVQDQAAMLTDVLQEQTQIKGRLEILNNDNHALRKSVADFRIKIQMHAYDMEYMSDTLDDVLQKCTEFEGRGIEGTGKSSQALETLPNLPDLLKIISVVIVWYLAFCVMRHFW